MSKALAIPRRKAVDLRTRAANDPRLASEVPVAGDDSSSPLSPTENAPCASASELDRLHACLDNVTPENHPHMLLASGTRKSAQKVIEEAGARGRQAPLAGRGPREADLLYHFVVLWRHVGVEPAEVWNEMRRRANIRQPGSSSR
jgi:phosphoribosyl-ATP pyrophosphohydrolase